MKYKKKLRNLELAKAWWDKQIRSSRMLQHAPEA